VADTQAPQVGVALAGLGKGGLAHRMDVVEQRHRLAQIHVQNPGALWLSAQSAMA
jgi:hypothetical protein